jgi:actin-related protein 8
MLLGENGTPLDSDVPMEDGMDTAGNPNEPHGAKIIVIHPGSQNLRVGLASDALPKTVPMCIARKWKESESEENGGEPAPKRLKMETEGLPKDKQHLSKASIFGDDFRDKYQTMATDLKARMRANKRKILPAQRDLIQKFNIQQQYQSISEHNDPHRIDWTEIPPGKAPEYYTGTAALRIPEKSRPRYRLTWPVRCGWFNERDYSDRNLLLNDFFTIIEDALKTELGLSRRDWRDYSCCFVIPDLYERNYVTLLLDSLMREFEFKRVCFIQESLAASFGNNQTLTCMVDIGAQKTSICCVEDGMCIEDSRINLKYGGWDVTELFIKMMLVDQFPYADINLKRRYDFLLAEELKEKFCTMNEGEVVVQLYDFHLRAANQDTRKYQFKTFDEPMLAPLAFYSPSILDHSTKLERRHKVIDRSYDLYDGAPNDPYSLAQAAAQAYASANIPDAVIAAAPEPIPAPAITATPSKPKPFNLLQRLPQEDTESTPRSSVAGSPAPEGTGTPQPSRDSPGPAATESGALANAGLPTIDKTTESLRLAEERNRVLPIMPLDLAILTSIREASKHDERKMREYFSFITVVGGGAKIPYFTNFLKEKLVELLGGPGTAFSEKVSIASPARETDSAVVVWKGGSVFARLSSSGNDSWVYGKEYDLLGSKLLAQKCMWNW